MKLRGLGQKAEFNRYIIRERSELRKSEIFAPRRAFNCADADVSRLIDECLARAPPFEFCPEAERDVETFAEPSEDEDMLEQHLALLEEELHYFALQSEGLSASLP